VIGIEGSQLPSRAAVESNAHALARYALLCQESEIVPIVEPEVLMEGTHSIDRCREVTRQVLTELFYQLARQGADMAGMVLKPSMVLAGDRSGQICTTEEVASATLGVLSDTVPASVPGVAFLSGGQSDANATAHLNQINRLAADPPWAITFSYGRALQRQALDTWRGGSANRQAAQAALLQKVKENSAAALGKA
jgi:fructose-bisphosphate aldolase class I